MSSDPKNKATERQWEKLYQQGVDAPRYPNGNVLRWLFGNFPKKDADQFHLLDIGCGMGRHAIMMKHEGYNVTGTEYSQTAVNQAKDWANQLEIDIPFSQSSADEQPFPDATFDGIVCFSVLSYLPYDRYLQATREIHRLLKPGGQCFIIVRNDQDVRKTVGKLTAPHQYKITAQDQDQDNDYPWHKEVGMEQTLLPKDEIQKFFSVFSDLRIEEVTSTLGNRKYREASWLIYARK